MSIIRGPGTLETNLLFKRHLSEDVEDDAITLIGIPVALVLHDTVPDIKGEFREIRPKSAFHEGSEEGPTRPRP